MKAVSLSAGRHRRQFGDIYAQIRSLAEEAGGQRTGSEDGGAAGYLEQTLIEVIVLDPTEDTDDWKTGGCSEK